MFKNLQTSSSDKKNGSSSNIIMTLLKNGKSYLNYLTRRI